MPSPANKKNPHRKAIVLLSGGLDSATALAMAHHEGDELIALSFRYGQKHHHELRAAKMLARHYAIAHHILPLPLDAIGESSLTDENTPVPCHHDTDARAIPSTYVPARNTIFIALALAMAETNAARKIIIGANHIDYSGYPDCRPAYFAAWQQLANLATKQGVMAEEKGESAVTIAAPLLDMSKADIIRAGLGLGVNYAMTSSCYQPLPTGRPCQKCDSCHLRSEAFRACGMTDPLLLSS